METFPTIVIQHCDNCNVTYANTLGHPLECPVCTDRRDMMPREATYAERTALLDRLLPTPQELAEHLHNRDSIRLGEARKWADIPEEWRTSSVHDATVMLEAVKTFARPGGGLL